LIPASDSGDDLIGISGPDEGFWVVVSLRQEAIDCRLEVDNRAEHAALQPSPSQLGKEALDGIEPGCRFRGVVEHKTGVPTEPSPHLRVLVAAVIVEDDVDNFADRGLGLDRIQKADEFLMPVALHAAADDLSFEDVEGGK
jgi:hypothetical protein